MSARHTPGPWWLEGPPANTRLIKAASDLLDAPVVQETKASDRAKAAQIEAENFNRAAYIKARGGA